MLTLLAFSGVSAVAQLIITPPTFVNANTVFNVQFLLEGGGSGGVAVYEQSGNGNAIATGTMSSGTARVGVAALSPGTHFLYGVGPGRITSSVEPVTVYFPVATGTTSTYTTLTIVGNTFASGTTVSMTATVANSVTTPTGTVAFWDDNIQSTDTGSAWQLLGTQTLNGSGQAVFQTSTLAVGRHNILVQYLGTSTFAPSQTPDTPFDITVANTYPVTVIYTENGTYYNNIPYTDQINLTAGVSIAPGANPPTGNLSFWEVDQSTGYERKFQTVSGLTQGAGGNYYGGNPFLAELIGTHTVYALYEGDTAGNSSGKSPQSSYQIQPCNNCSNNNPGGGGGGGGTYTPSDSLTLQSSLNPSLSGNPVTFTATVYGSDSSRFSGSAKITDTFNGSTTTLGTGPVDTSAGTYSIPANTLAVGSHTITATYAGDSYYPVPTPATLTQIVYDPNSQLPTTTTLVSSLNPALLGQQVTLTATVAKSVGTAALTGTVTFYDNYTGTSVSLGSASVGTNGKASIAVSTLIVGTHPLTAVYSGSTNYATSTSTILNQVINNVTFSFNVTTNPYTINVNDLTQVKGTLTGTFYTAPTGTVTFTDMTNISAPIALGTVPVDATASATLAVVGQTTGIHNVRGVYSGDSNYAARISAANYNVNTAVSVISPLLTVTTSPDPTAVGAAVKITVTAVNAATNAPLSGTVTLTDAVGGTAQTPFGSGTTVTVTGGTGSKSGVTTLILGGHRITATLAATPTLVQATADTTHTVTASGGSTLLADSITLTTTPNPSAVNSTVTMTATVIPTGGGATPTGTISFYDSISGSPVLIYTGPVDTTGATTGLVWALSSGCHPITATYFGNTLYQPVTSAVVTQTVGTCGTTPTLISTTTALTSSKNPSNVGDNVTFTATVTPSTTGGATPTGTVAFTDSVSGSLGSGTLDNTGKATVSTATLAQGTHIITAVYGGDTVNSGSTSTGLSQVVNAAGTITSTTTLTLSPNPVATTGTVTFSSHTVLSTGGAPLVGTVTYYINTGTWTSFGTATTDTSGNASLPVPLGGSLNSGVYSTEAIYSGPSPASTSPTVPLNIGTSSLTSTVTTLSSSLNPAAVTQNVTLTAHVAPSTGSGTPTGTVTFTDNGTPLGTVAVDGSDNATFSTSSLIVGTHPITATYSGDGTFASSASTVLNQVIVGNGAFGPEPVGMPSPTPQPFYVTFGGPNPVTLGTPVPVTDGVPNLDFTIDPSTTCVVGQTYQPNTNCAMMLVFKPTYPGLRKGAVLIYDSTGHVIQTIYVSGTGTAPLLAFYQGAVSTSAIGSSLGTETKAPVLVSGGAQLFYNAGGTLYGYTTTGTALNTKTTGAFSSSAIDGAGNIWLVGGGSANATVYNVVTGLSQTVTQPTATSAAPVAVAVDANGTAYFVTGTSSTIYIRSTSGTVTQLVPTGVTLGTLAGIAVSPTGTIALSDSTNNHIVSVNPTTGAATLVSAGTLSAPTVIHYDALANLYLLDSGNKRIVEIRNDGTSLLPAVNATFTAPNDLAIDPVGNLWITDVGATQTTLLKVDLSDAPSLRFTDTTIGSTSSDSPRLVLPTNIGNAPLTLSALSTTLGVADFNYATSGTNVCSTGTAPPNASCTLNANFKPSASGARTGTITLTTDSLNVPNTLSILNLSGNGLTPLINTVMTLTPGPGTTATYGNTETVLVSIAQAPNSPKATGTITYTVNGTQYTATLVNGAFTINEGVLPAGTYTFVVNYLGDTVYGPTSQTVTITVNKAQPILTAVAQTVNYGLGGTVPVTATGVTGQAYPTGAVAYTIGTTNGNAPLTSGLGGIPFTGTLAPGLYPVTLNYPGDSNYLSATGSTTVTINQVTPTLTFPGGGPITYGTTLTGVLNATGSVPGTIVYTATDSHGNVIIVTNPSLLPAGVYTITATLTPTDPNYPSISKTATLTVNPAMPVISASPITVIYGDGGSLPFTIAGIPNAPAPTGTITYTLNGVTYTITLASGGGTIPLPANLPAGSYTITFSYPGSGNYGPATGSVVVTVQKAVLTARAADATRVFGTANPAFTATLTGIKNAESFTATAATTATIVSPVGTYAITPSITGATLSNYSLTTVNGTLTVVKAAAAIALVSSDSQPGLGNPFTLTATVTSATTGTPTGTVSFYEGTTLLGTGSLSGGIATLTLSNLPLGVHTITAVYGGDLNFTSVSTSTPITVTVVLPDFFITVNKPTLTIRQGQTAELVFTFTPVGGFKGTVTFACQNLPSYATCVFTPPSLTAAGDNLVQTTQLHMITTGASSGIVARNRMFGPHPALAGMLLLPTLLIGVWLASARRRAGRSLGRIGTLMLALIFFSGITALSGCGCIIDSTAGVTVVTATASASAASSTAATGATKTASVSITITQ